MPVNRKQLMDELQIKLSNDKEARDATKEVAELVEMHWKAIAPGPGEHYATGAYRASIHRVAIRDRVPKGHKGGGRFLYHHRVITLDPIAHLLEYGTLPDHDPSLSKGNWWDLEGVHQWGWKTPTPAFGFAADVENSFNSTIARGPRRRRKGKGQTFRPISRGNRPRTSGLRDEDEDEA